MVQTASSAPSAEDLRRARRTWDLDFLKYRELPGYNEIKALRRVFEENASRMRGVDGTRAARTFLRDALDWPIRGDVALEDLREFRETLKNINSHQLLDEHMRTPPRQQPSLRTRADEYKRVNQLNDEFRKNLGRRVQLPNGDFGRRNPLGALTDADDTMRSLKPENYKDIYRHAFRELLNDGALHVTALDDAGRMDDLRRIFTNLHESGSRDLIEKFFTSLPARQLKDPIVSQKLFAYMTRNGAGTIDANSIRHADRLLREVGLTIDDFIKSFEAYAKMGGDEHRIAKAALEETLRHDRPGWREAVERNLRTVDPATQRDLRHALHITDPNFCGNPADVAKRTRGILSRWKNRKRGSG